MDQIHPPPWHALEVERSSQRSWVAAVVPDRDHRRGHLLVLLAAETRATLQVGLAREAHERQEPHEPRRRRWLQDHRVHAGGKFPGRPGGLGLVAGTAPDRLRVDRVHRPREHLGEPAAALGARDHGGDRGLRRRGPASLALGVGQAQLQRDGLVCTRRREPVGAGADEPGDGVGAGLGGGVGGSLEESVAGGNVGHRRQAWPERVGTDDLGHLLGALGGGARPVGCGVVGRRDAHPAVGHHTDPQAGVFARRALVDLALGEPRQRAPLVHEQDLDIVDPTQCQGGIGDPPEPVGPHQARHQRTPTWTLRNRAGDAPCPTRPTCPGWPLPQFGVPQTTQSSAPPTASHAPQNSGASPV